MEQVMNQNSSIKTEAKPAYSQDIELVKTTKKMFIFSIVSGAIIALSGILILAGILNANIMAIGAYNAPMSVELVNQVFGCSLILMGFMTFDIGKCAYLGATTGRMTRFFGIHTFILIVLGFMGVIVCAGKAAFGWVYLFCLIKGVAYLIIAAKKHYPMDLG